MIEIVVMIPGIDGWREDLIIQLHHLVLEKVYVYQTFPGWIVFKSKSINK